jgi:hypothetical protein
VDRWGGGLGEQEGGLGFDLGFSIEEDGEEEEAMADWRCLF